MKIYTIENGRITEGVEVSSYTLKGAGIIIPAITVGEEGRGRELGVLPVQLLPESYAEWQEKGYTQILYAEIGATMAGKPKLFQVEYTDITEKCICIFRTKIGFRGGNSHTGDRKYEYWVPNRFWRSDIVTLGEKLKEKYTEKEAVEIAKKLNSSLDSSYQWDVIFQRKLEFHPFPGEILCEGVIAQGEAGRVGSGEQLVAVLPADTVFRTGYSGRLYGAPSAHYYLYRDGQILSATWEEREVADIF